MPRQSLLNFLSSYNLALLHHPLFLSVPHEAGVVDLIPQIWSPLDSLMNLLVLAHDWNFYEHDMNKDKWLLVIPFTIADLLQFICQVVHETPSNRPGWHHIPAVQLIGQLVPLSVIYPSR